jgi:hypothetical protein
MRQVSSQELERERQKMETLKSVDLEIYMEFQCMNTRIRVLLPT